jgi:hypothetical protein
MLAATIKSVIAIHSPRRTISAVNSPAKTVIAPLHILTVQGTLLAACSRHMETFASKKQLNGAPAISLIRRPRKLDYIIVGLISADVFSRKIIRLM